MRSGRAGLNPTELWRIGEKELNREAEYSRRCVLDGKQLVQSFAYRLTVLESVSER